MGVRDKRPVELFDYGNIDRSYKELLKKHHPDVGGNEEDFIYIQKVYKTAIQEKEAGYANRP